MAAPGEGVVIGDVGRSVYDRSAPGSSRYVGKAGLLGTFDPIRSDRSSLWSIRSGLHDRPMKTPTERSERIRRLRAHQCTTCRTPWALRVVDHPAGRVVLCVHCGTVRSSTWPELHAVGTSGQAHDATKDRGA